MVYYNDIDKNAAARHLAMKGERILRGAPAPGRRAEPAGTVQGFREPADPSRLTGMRTASSAGSYACGDGRLQANKAGACR